MSYSIYYVIEDDTLPVLFDTFDGGTGASITMTGLAVTDIEIYKDGGTTQRSSDAGYTLLDTDGIDFDTTTGIHGFSIDLSDNTDAGFYAVGSWYHVVVSAITVDAQTVSFVAAAFRILDATRGMAGTALPDAVADAAGGLPISDAGALDLDTFLGRITGNVALASVMGALTDAAAAGDPTTADTLMQYAKQLINVLVGTAGVGTWPASAAPANAVSISEALRAIYDDSNELQADDVPGLIAALNDPTAAAIADAVWDEPKAGHVGATTFGDLATDLDATLADTNELQADDVPGLIAALNDPTSAAIADAVWDEAKAGHTGSTTFGDLATDLDAVLADTNELQTDWADAGRLDTILDARASQTTADAIETDTQDIQSRLPAALTTGTADSGTTTTMVDAARAEGDTDYWSGSWIRFTSGTISGQTRLITGFTPASDATTFAPATTQAVATNTYEILPAGGVDVQEWLSSTVNALVAGAVDADVSALQNDVVTAAAIAADAITSSELATTAVNEIRDAILSDSTAFAGANVDATISSRATPAQVNTEVSDVMKTDTISEMAQQAPPATPTFEEAVMYVYMALRNKLDVTSTLKEFHNDAGTVTWKKTLSDDGTTYSEAEGATGP